MSRREPKFDLKKIEGLRSGPAWRVTYSFLKREVGPLLNKLNDNKFDSDIEKPLKKYLIISISTFIEQYFKNLARRIVDKERLDVTKLFKDEIRIPISQLDSILAQGKLTKGYIVASSYNFADPNQIDELFTYLLKLDLRIEPRPAFLEIIQMAQRAYPQVYLSPDDKPFDIDREKFVEALRHRNAIVHEMKDIEITNSELGFLWENAINIVSAADMIMDPVHRKEVREIVIKHFREAAKKTSS